MNKIINGVKVLCLIVVVPLGYNALVAIFAPGDMETSIRFGWVCLAVACIFQIASWNVKDKQ